ncbi:hypothetical protein [Silvibacterium acidisoli]|uniref:hypothetical protein n=1 Tax=Acidobacteriaceae bacterium ZG23-2 TaxID=2883246 RepID=UPI00406C6BD1
MMNLLARCGRGCVVLGLVVASLPLHADSKHKTEKAEPEKPPVARIAVEPLGFFPPSRALLSYRLSMATLNFIDEDKLLFTFREHALLKRIPGDNDDDPDQSIKAVVLDIATGKVLNETQWRMHDRQHYLWSLRGGKFMVRQRNSLYLTDEKLELRPYLDFQSPLRAVEVSPNRMLMVIETEKRVPAAQQSGDGATHKAPSLLSDDGSASPPEVKRIQVMLLHPGENRAIGGSESRQVLELPMVDNGILSLISGNGPDRWMIRRFPLPESVDKPLEGDAGNPQTMVEFRSTCQPDVNSLSGEVVMTVGCAPGFGDDHAVTAYTTSGTQLWQDRWLERYIWPTFDYAENGTRFVYSSLEMNRKVGSMDSFGQEDVAAQVVGVFNTGTGKLEMVRDASPVMSAGQNYAISADGRRFAILREGTIEIYDLPGASLPPSVPISRK